MKRFKRYLKRTAITLAVLFGLVVIALGASYLYLGSDSGQKWVKSQIESRANEALRGQLSVGNLEGHALSGMVLDRVHLESNDGHTVLEAEEIELEYSPIDLIGSKPYLESITVRGAKLFVRRDSDGKINIANLAIEDSSSSSSGLTIEHLVLVDCELHVVDERSLEGRELHFIDVHGDIRIETSPVESNQHPSETSLRVHVRELSAFWQEEERQVVARGKVRIDEILFEIEDVVLGSEGTEVAISEVVIPREPGDAVQGRFKLGIQANDVRTLGLANAREPLGIAGTLDGTRTAPKAEVHMSMGPSRIELVASGHIPERRGKLSLEFETIRPSVAGDGLPKGVASGHFELDGSNLDQGLKATVTSSLRATLSPTLASMELQPIALKADVSTQQGQAKVELSAKGGENLDFSASGAFQLAEELDLTHAEFQADVELAKVSELIAMQPALRGRVQAQGSLDKDQDMYRSEGSLNAPSLRQHKLRAENLVASWNLRLDPRTQRASGSAILRIGRATNGEIKVSNIRLRADELTSDLKEAALDLSVKEARSPSMPTLSQLKLTSRLSRRSNGILVSDARARMLLGGEALSLRARDIMRFDNQRVRVRGFEAKSILGNAKGDLLVAIGRTVRPLSAHLELDKLELEKLARQLPDQGVDSIRGRVNAVLDLHRGKKVTAKIWAKGLSVDALKTHSLNIKLVAESRKDFSFELRAVGANKETLSLEAKGRVPGNLFRPESLAGMSVDDLKTFDFELSDVDLQTLSRFEIGLPPLLGHADLQASLTEGKKGKRLEAKLGLVNLRPQEEEFLTRFQSSSTSTLSQSGDALTQRARKVRAFDFRAEFASDRSISSAAVSLELNSIPLVRATGQVQVSLSELLDFDGMSTVGNSALRAKIEVPRLPAEVLCQAAGLEAPFRGFFRGHFNISGKILEPFLGGQLASHELSIAGQRLPQVFVGAKADQEAQHIWARLNHPMGGGHLSLIAHDPFRPTQGTFVAEAKAFDLQFLNELFLHMRVPVAALKGKLEGTIKGPLLGHADETEGRLRIRHGQVALPAPLEVFEDINLNFAMANDHLDLSIYGTSGKGKASLALRMGLSTWLPSFLKGELSMDELPLSMPGLAARAGGKVSLDTVREDQSWKGRLEVKKLDIHLPTLPKSVDLHPTGDLEDVEFIGAESEGDASVLIPAVDLEIVSARDAIEVSTKDVHVHAGLQMKLVKTLDQEDFELRGKILVVEGDVNLLGRKYKLTKGVLDFDRGSEGNPFVDLRVERQFPNAKISIHVHGLPPDIEVDLFSEPSIYQEGQILSLIVNGRTSDTGTQDDAALGAAAGLLGRELTSGLRSPVGVDSFSVDTEGGGTVSSLALGKWLTDTVFIAYHRNFNPDPTKNQDEARLEWWLTPRWLLEVAAGDAGAGSGDLLWILRF